MLVDLLSTANMVSFNIKVAEVFGLHSAIYISELTNIYEKALRKKKIENYGGHTYFTIDRKYLTSRTTLSTKEQKDIEASLVQVEVLKVHPTNTDTIYLNIDGLASLLGTEIDKTILQRIGQIAKKKTVEEAKQGKLIGQIKSAKASVRTADVQLRNAYYNWIDAFAAKFGYISPSVVKINEEMVDSFAKGNIGAAISVVNTTAQHSWRSMEYAIKSYLEQHPTQVNNVETSRVISVGQEAF